MKRNPGTSESRLRKLWREAVLGVWPYDPFTGESRPSQLQCHHIVYRRYWVLRWDWRNGIALSHESHRRVHGVEGSGLVLNRLTDHHRDYLLSLHRVTKPEYLTATGMSEAEFLQMRRNELEHVIHVGVNMNDAGYFRVPEGLR